MAFPSSRRARRFNGLAVCLFIGWFAADRAAAQSTAARVSGTIYDEQRAVLPGASITLTSIETGAVRSAVSGPAGAFRLIGLSPGRYTMKVEDANFAPVVRSLELAINDDVEFEAVLQLAALTQSLQVKADAPLFEPSKTALARTITTRQIDDLPVASRDFTNLALLSSGILVNQVATGTSTGIAAAAQTGRNNTYLLDGLTLDDTYASAARATLPLDAVREFVVLSNNFSAEFGQASGAVLSVTTRSGANQRTARVYYYHRDDSWDATSHAARLAGLADSIFEQRIAGGFLGGPIVRDRAFFFGSVERTMLDTENIVTSPVLHTFRPGAPTHTPAANRISQLFGRSDLSLAPSNQLTARVRIQRGTRTNQLGASDVGVAAPERGFDVTNRPYDAGLWHSLAAGTSRLNEFRLQFAQNGFDRDPSAYCAGCPEEDRSSIRLGKLATVPNSLAERRVQFADNFTWLLPAALGDHSFKAGIDVSAIGVDWRDLPDADGTFTFRNDLVFDPGNKVTYPVQYTRTIGTPNIHLDHTTYAAFAQDSWKPRANVTINAGLRWDYDHAPGVSADTANFAPRVAVAFVPAGSRATAIRGGYGRYYDQVPLNVARLAEQAKTALQILLRDPGYPDPSGFNPNRRVDAAPGAPSTTRLADMTVAFTDQLTAGIQRTVSPEIAVTVDALYARGRRLLVTHDLNYPDLDDPALARPDPAFQRVLAVESRGNSWYRGLQVGVEKRPSRGYSYTAAYTLSWSERDTEDYTFVPQDQRDFAAERGPGANDVRHRLSTALNVDLPLGLRFATIVTAQTALPYTITTGTDDNLDTNINDRPPGVGRNSARGADFWQADARISKSFRTGIGRFEVLVEVFNVANRANWSGFDGRKTSRTYGGPTTALPSRQVQAGIRLDF